MLGTLAKGLGLPEPVARAEHPQWVWAQTLHLEGGMHLLLVYRSTWLRDGDFQYQNVKAVLDRCDTVEPLYNRERDDEAMMHGRARWELYALNPIKEPGAITKLVIDFVKDWGAPMSPLDVPAEIHARLPFLKISAGGMQ